MVNSLVSYQGTRSGSSAVIEYLALIGLLAIIFIAIYIGFRSRSSASAATSSHRSGKAPIYAYSSRTTGALHPTGSTVGGSNASERLNQFFVQAYTEVAKRTKAEPVPDQTGESITDPSASDPVVVELPKQGPIIEVLNEDGTATVITKTLATPQVLRTPYGLVANSSWAIDRGHGHIHMRR